MSDDNKRIRWKDEETWTTTAANRSQDAWASTFNAFHNLIWEESRKWFWWWIWWFITDVAWWIIWWSIWAIWSLPDVAWNILFDSWYYDNVWRWWNDLKAQAQKNQEAWSDWVSAWLDAIDQKARSEEWNISAQTLYQLINNPLAAKGLWKVTSAWWKWVKSLGLFSKWTQFSKWWNVADDLFTTLWKSKPTWIKWFINDSMTQVKRWKSGASQSIDNAFDYMRNSKAWKAITNTIDSVKNSKLWQAASALSDSKVGKWLSKEAWEFKKWIWDSRSFIFGPFWDAWVIWKNSYNAFKTTLKTQWVWKAVITWVSDLIWSSLQYAWDFLSKPFSFRLPKIWEAETSDLILWDIIWEPIWKMDNKDDFRDEYWYTIEDVAWATDDKMLETFYNNRDIAPDKRLTREQIDSYYKNIWDNTVWSITEAWSNIYKVTDLFSAPSEMMSNRLEYNIEIERNSRWETIDIKEWEKSWEDIIAEDEWFHFTADEEEVKVEDEDWWAWDPIITDDISGLTDLEKIEHWANNWYLTNSWLNEINEGVNTKFHNIYTATQINEAGKEHVNKVIDMFTPEEIAKNPQLQKELVSYFSAYSDLFNWVAFAINQLPADEYDPKDPEYFMRVLSMSLEALPSDKQALIMDNIYQKSIDFNNELDASTAYIKLATKYKRTVDDMISVFDSNDRDFWAEQWMLWFATSPINPESEWIRTTLKEISASVEANWTYLVTVFGWNYINNRLVEPTAKKYLTKYITANPRWNTRLGRWIVWAWTEMSSEFVENFMDEVSLVESSDTDSEYFKWLVIWMIQGAVWWYSSADSSYTSFKNYISSPENRNEVLNNLWIYINQIEDPKQRAFALSLSSQIFDNMVTIMTDVAWKSANWVEWLMQWYAIYQTNRMIQDYTSKVIWLAVDRINEKNQLLKDQWKDWSEEDILEVFNSKKDFANYNSWNSFRLSESFVNNLLASTKEDRERISNTAAAFIKSSFDVAWKSLREWLNYMAPKVARSDWQKIDTPITDEKTALWETLTQLDWNPIHDVVTMFMWTWEMPITIWDRVWLNKKTPWIWDYKNNQIRDKITYTDQQWNDKTVSAKEYIIDQIINNKDSDLSTDERIFISTILFKTTVSWINSYFEDDWSLSRLWQDFFKNVMPSITENKSRRNFFEKIQKIQQLKVVKAEKSERDALKAAKANPVVSMSIWLSAWWVIKNWDDISNLPDETEFNISKWDRKLNLWDIRAWWVEVNDNWDKYKLTDNDWTFVVEKINIPEAKDEKTRKEETVEQMYTLDIWFFINQWRDPFAWYTKEELIRLWVYISDRDHELWIQSKSLYDQIEKIKKEPENIDSNSDAISDKTIRLRNAEEAFYALEKRRKKAKANLETLRNYIKWMPDGVAQQLQQTEENKDENNWNAEEWSMKQIEENNNNDPDTRDVNVPIPVDHEYPDIPEWKVKSARDFIRLWDTIKQDIPFLPQKEITVSKETSDFIEAYGLPEEDRHNSTKEINDNFESYPIVKVRKKLEDWSETVVEYRAVPFLDYAITDENARMEWKSRWTEAKAFVLVNYNEWERVNKYRTISVRPTAYPTERFYFQDNNVVMDVVWKDNKVVEWNRTLVFWKHWKKWTWNLSTTIQADRLWQDTFNQSFDKNAVFMNESKNSTNVAKKWFLWPESITYDSRPISVAADIVMNDENVYIDFAWHWIPISDKWYSSDFLINRWNNQWSLKKFFNAIWEWQQYGSFKSQTNTTNEAVETEQSNTETTNEAQKVLEWVVEDIPAAEWTTEEEPKKTAAEVKKEVKEVQNSMNEQYDSWMKEVKNDPTALPTTSLQESANKVFNNTAKDDSEYTEVIPERSAPTPSKFTFNDWTTVDTPFELSNDQKNALNALDDFMKTDDSYYIINWYAWTWKTSIINILLDKYSNKNQVIAAPTHKALNVISSKAPWRTYYTTAQLFMKFSRNSKWNVDFTSTYDIKHEKERPVVSRWDILVIDEASMLPEDVVKSALYTAKKYWFKIIFMWDDFQLPPVNEKESYIFSEEVSKWHTSKLTEVKRNQWWITSEATILRTEWKYSYNTSKDLQSEFIKSWEPIQGSNAAIVVNQDVTSALWQWERFETNKQKIINWDMHFCAYRNMTVKMVNDYIRSRIFNTSWEPKKWERIMWYDSPALNNWEMYKIENADNEIWRPTDDEVLNWEIWHEEKTEDWRILRTYDLTFTDWYWRLFYKWEFSFYVNKYKVTVDWEWAGRSIALIDNNDSHNKEELKRYTEILENELAKAKTNKRTPYFVLNTWDPLRDLTWVAFSDEIKIWQSKIINKWWDFWYAMTTHKSQWSTFDTVVILDNDFFWNDVLKLKYTALTRWARKAIVVTSNNVVWPKDPNNVVKSTQNTNKEPWSYIVDGSVLNEKNTKEYWNEWKWDIPAVRYSVDWNPNHSFWNPFSPLPNSSAKVKVKTIAEAVSRFESWLKWESDQDVKPEQRKWIIDQIHNWSLKWKNVIYYTDDVTGWDYFWDGSNVNKYDPETAPSHAHILKAMIDWTDTSTDTNQNIPPEDVDVIDYLMNDAAYYASSTFLGDMIIKTVDFFTKDSETQNWTYKTETPYDSLEWDWNEKVMDVNDMSPEEITEFNDKYLKNVDNRDKWTPRSKKAEKEVAQTVAALDTNINWGALRIIIEKPFKALAKLNPEWRWNWTTYWHYISWPHIIKVWSQYRHTVQHEIWHAFDHMIAKELWFTDRVRYASNFLAWRETNFSWTRNRLVMMFQSLMRDIIREWYQKWTNKDEERDRYLSEPTERFARFVEAFVQNTTEWTFEWDTSWIKETFSQETFDKFKRFLTSLAIARASDELRSTETLWTWTEKDRFVEAWYSEDRVDNDPYDKDMFKWKALTFTWHRFWPKFKKSYKDEDVKALRQSLTKWILDKWFTTIYNWWASWFDSIAWLAAIAAKKENPDIKIITVIPWNWQSNNYSAEEKSVYEYLIANSDKVINIENEKDYYNTTSSRYIDRDNYMADKWDVVLSLYNWEHSWWTFRTMERAYNNWKIMFSINPKDLTTINNIPTKQDKNTVSDKELETITENVSVDTIPNPTQIVANTSNSNRQIAERHLSDKWNIDELVKDCEAFWIVFESLNPSELANIIYAYEKWLWLEYVMYEFTDKMVSSRVDQRLIQMLVNKWVLKMDGKYNWLTILEANAYSYMINNMKIENLRKIVDPELLDTENWKYFYEALADYYIRNYFHYNPKQWWEKFKKFRNKVISVIKEKLLDSDIHTAEKDNDTLMQWDDTTMLLNLESMDKELVSSFAQAAYEKKLISKAKYNYLMWSNPYIANVNNWDYNPWIVASWILDWINTIPELWKIASKTANQSKMMVLLDIYNYFTWSKTGNYKWLIKYLEAVNNTRTPENCNKEEISNIIKILKKDTQDSMNPIHQDETMKLLSEPVVEIEWSPYQDFAKNKKEASIIKALKRLEKKRPSEFNAIVKYAPLNIKQQLFTDFYEDNKKSHWKNIAYWMVAFLLPDSRQVEYNLKKEVSEVDELDEESIEILSTYNRRALLSPVITQNLILELWLLSLDKDKWTVILTDNQEDALWRWMTSFDDTKAYPLLSVGSLKDLKLDVNVIVPAWLSIPKWAEETFNIVKLPYAWVHQWSLVITSYWASDIKARQRMLNIFWTSWIWFSNVEWFELSDAQKQIIDSNKWNNSLYRNIFKYNILPNLWDEYQNMKQSAFESMLDWDILESVDSETLYNSFTSWDIDSIIDASVKVINFVTHDALWLKSNKASNRNWLEYKKAIESFIDFVQKDVITNTQKKLLIEMFNDFVTAQLAIWSFDRWERFKDFRKKHSYALSIASQLFKWWYTRDTNNIFINNEKIEIAPETTAVVNATDIETLSEIKVIDNKIQKLDKKIANLEAGFNRIKTFQKSVSEWDEYYEYIKSDMFRKVYKRRYEELRKAKIWLDNLIEQRYELWQEYSVAELVSEQGWAIDEDFAKNSNVNWQSFETKYIYEDNAINVLGNLFNEFIKPNIITKWTVSESTWWLNIVSKNLSNIILWWNLFKTEYNMELDDDAELNTQKSKNRKADIKSSDLMALQWILATKKITDPKWFDDLLNKIIRVPDSFWWMWEIWVNWKLTEAKKEISKNPALFYKIMWDLLNDNTLWLDIFYDMEYEKTTSYQDVNEKWLINSLNEEFYSTKPLVKLDPKDVEKYHEEYDKYFNIKDENNNKVNPSDEQIIAFAALKKSFDNRSKWWTLAIPWIAWTWKSTLLAALFKYVIDNSWASQETTNIQQGKQTSLIHNFDSSEHEKLRKYKGDKKPHYIKILNSWSKTYIYAEFNWDDLQNREEIENATIEELREWFWDIWSDEWIKAMAEVWWKEYESWYERTVWKIKNLKYVETLPEWVSDNDVINVHWFQNYVTKRWSKEKVESTSWINDVRFAVRTWSTVWSIRDIFVKQLWISWLTAWTIDWYLEQEDSTLLNDIWYATTYHIKESENVTWKIIIVDETQNAYDDKLRALVDWLSNNNVIVFLWDIHQMSKWNFLKDVSWDFYMVETHRWTKDIQDTNLIASFTQNSMSKANAIWLYMKDSEDFVEYESQDIFKLMDEPPREALMVCWKNENRKAVNDAYLKHKWWVDKLVETWEPIQVMVVDIESDKQSDRNRKSELVDWWLSLKWFKKHKSWKFYYKQDKIPNSNKYNTKIFFPSTQDTSVQDSDIASVLWDFHSHWMWRISTINKKWQRVNAYNWVIEIYVPAFAITTEKESWKTVNKIALHSDVTYSDYDFLSEKNVKQYYDAFTRWAKKVYIPKNSTRLIWITREQATRMINGKWLTSVIINKPTNKKTIENINIPSINNGKYSWVSTIERITMVLWTILRYVKPQQKDLIKSSLKELNEFKTILTKYDLQEWLKPIDREIYIKSWWRVITWPENYINDIKYRIAEIWDSVWRSLEPTYKETSKVQEEVLENEFLYNSIKYINWIIYWTTIKTPSAPDWTLLLYWEKKLAYKKIDINFLNSIQENEDKVYEWSLSDWRLLTPVTKIDSEWRAYVTLSPVKVEWKTKIREWWIGKNKALEKQIESRNHAWKYISAFDLVNDNIKEIEERLELLNNEESRVENISKDKYIKKRIKLINKSLNNILEMVIDDHDKLSDSDYQVNVASWMEGPDYRTNWLWLQYKRITDNIKNLIWEKWDIQGVYSLIDMDENLQKDVLDFVEKVNSIYNEESTANLMDYNNGFDAWSYNETAATDALDEQFNCNN